MFKCPFCDYQNEPEEKRCKECGTELEIDFSEEDIEVETLGEGDIIDERYEIEGLINSGGMGAIYKAYDRSLGNKICVIKELLSTALSVKEKTDAIRRFKREGAMLSTLEHKYLPGVSDFFTLENKYYLVMDYVDGHDLEYYLKTKGTMKEDKFIELMLQVCEVLDYLHSQKPPIIYRDMKPSNIMVSNEDGKIRLIDFGIARVIEGDYGTSTRVGSVGFASPEHYRGIPDNRSDIFSLGATMHALLTGTMPNYICSFEPVNKLNPEISSRLSNIVMKAVRIKPEERFQDVKDLAGALSGEKEVTIEDAAEYRQMEALSAQLTVNNPELKKQVIKSLSEMKIDSAINPLLKVLKEDEDWMLRKDALLALKNFKDKKENLTGELMDLYKEEPDSRVRAAFIRIFGFFKTKNTFDLIVSALNDSDEEVQFRAIVALGTGGDIRGLDPLCRFVNEGNSVLLNDAYMSIEKIDPAFYASWIKKKEKGPHQKNNIENIKLVFSIFLLIFISLLVFKFVDYYKNNIMVNEKFKEGETYLLKGKYNKAREIFTDIISLRPDDGNAYYNLALACKNLREYETAIEHFNKAIELDKFNPDYLVKLGELYIEIKKFDMAISVLNKAVKLDNNLAEAYLSLGIAYKKSGNINKASEIFNYSLNNFPEINTQAKKQLDLLEETPVNSQLEIANKYIIERKYDDAIQACNEILYLSPENTIAYYLRGMAYYFKGDYDSAKVDLERLLNPEPDNFEVYNILGEIEILKNNYIYALELGNKSLKLSPDNNPNAHLIKGMAYFKTNNKVEARKELELYLLIAPDGENASLAREYLEEL